MERAAGKQAPRDAQTVAHLLLLWHRFRDWLPIRLDERRRLGGRCLLCRRGLLRRLLLLCAHLRQRRRRERGSPGRCDSAAHHPARGVLLLYGPSFAPFVRLLLRHVARPHRNRNRRAGENGLPSSSALLPLLLPSLFHLLPVCVSLPSTRMCTLGTWSLSLSLSLSSSCCCSYKVPTTCGGLVIDCAGAVLVL